MAEKNASYSRVLEVARDSGVTVALGSDCVHGGISSEMQYLVKAGFSTQEALIAGTAAGADLIGRDDLGRLRAGSRADVVFVDGDPVEDIAAADRIRGVMCDGRWQVKP
jgi:imidazolonepropionase-like amidohydrolase